MSRIQQKITHDIKSQKNNNLEKIELTDTSTKMNQMELVYKDFKVVIIKNALTTN